MAVAPASSRATATAGGALTQLFDSTLGAPAASIDTGAGGVSQAFAHLLIALVLQTTDVAVGGAVGLRFNNDSGANYDNEFVLGTNVTASAGPTLAATSALWSVHGASGSATYPSPVEILVPCYAQTSFWKACTMLTGRPDAAAANSSVSANYLGWRSTAAITRIAVLSATATLAAGSRMTIYGLS